MTDSGRPGPSAAARGNFITPALSIYLDAARLLAALAVLVGHVDQDGLGGSWMGIGRFSHEAVVVFFVLSGLVIAHSTIGLGRGARDYAIARMARLYSVVLPAIVLSFVVKGLAALFDPALAADYLRTDLRLSNVVGSVLFLNESWGLGTELPWNGPFWSLCYEAWYYVLFGLAVFVQGRRAQVAWVALAALFAGPAIVVMFPLWMLGAWLSRQGGRWAMPPAAALLLWAGTVLAFVALRDSGLPLVIQQALYHGVPGYWRLQSSQSFITDYLFGGLVAANFVAARSMLLVRPGLVRRASAVPVMAGFTFSLYLFHRPLTEAAGHFFPNRSGSALVGLGWTIGVVALCVLLGLVTEARKRQSRTWVAAIFDTVARRLRPLAS